MEYGVVNCVFPDMSFYYVSTYQLKFTIYFTKNCKKYLYSNLIVFFVIEFVKKISFQ